MNRAGCSCSFSIIIQLLPWGRLCCVGGFEGSHDGHLVDKEHAGTHLLRVYQELQEHPEVVALAVPSVAKAATDAHERLLTWVKLISGWKQSDNWDEKRAKVEVDMKAFDDAYSIVIDYSKCLAVMTKEQSSELSKQKDKDRATRERFSRFYTKRKTPNMIARCAAARDLQLQDYSVSSGMTGLQEVPHEPTAQDWLTPKTLFASESDKLSPVHHYLKKFYEASIASIKEKLPGHVKKMTRSTKSHGVGVLPIPKLSGDALCKHIWVGFEAAFCAARLICRLHRLIAPTAHPFGPSPDRLTAGSPTAPPP